MAQKDIVEARLTALEKAVTELKEAAKPKATKKAAKKATK